MNFRFESPEMPFVEAYHRGNRQRPTMIILSPSFTTSDRGAALGVALRWHSKTSPHDSGHYSVDKTNRYRCTPDDIVAGHSDCADKGTIKITICAEPASSSQFWDEEVHRDVLSNAAGLVAELLVIHKIRAVLVGEKEMSSWEKHKWRRNGGIYLHASGFDWPYQSFITEVKAHI